MEIQILHMVTANSYQMDLYHSALNQRDYNEFTARMPTFPCYTLAQNPVTFATQFCNVLSKITSVNTSSVYFPIWLHDRLAERPVYFIDNINESIFGGEPQNPRLTRPKSAIESHNETYYEDKTEFYLTSFNNEIDPKQIQTGLKMISREIYSILGKSRIMNIFTGKFTHVRIVNSTTIEVEVHTVGTVFQFGIQKALQDYFLKKNPRTLTTFHLGAEIPEKELNEIAKSASQ